MKKINWGVIGLGNIAQRFSESFLEVQNSNLLAIASKDSLKLEQNKKKLGSYWFRKYRPKIFRKFFRSSKF